MAPSKRYVKNAQVGDAEYKNTVRDKETVDYVNEKYGKAESPSSAVKYKTDNMGSQRYSVDSEPSRQRRTTGTDVSPSGPKSSGDAPFFKHTIKGK
jgi:hypothetical protein